MSDRFDKNLHALRHYLSDTHWNFLSTSDAPDIGIRQDNGRHNLLINDQPLYTPDAETFSTQQVTQFLKAPSRIIYDQIPLYHLYETSKLLRRAKSSDLLNNQLRHGVIPCQVNAASLAENRNCAALVVAGIGAGYHIEKLVEKCHFNHLIICDYFIDFLQASLHLADWAKITDRLESRGGSLRFFIGEHPAHVAAACALHLRQIDRGLLPGSWFYPHYDLDPDQSLVNNLMLHLQEAKSYNGWLEDEQTHLNNILVNFRPESACADIKTEKISLFTNKKPASLSSPFPIVIVGSGPSLAAFLPVLKANRDKIFIFSCGSSLKPLLDNDIFPDLHIELENVDEVNDLMDCIKDPAVFSKLPLFASATISPGVARRFKSVIFFGREGDGTPRLLNGMMEKIPFSGRSATNSACAFAFKLNPPALFLMGIDFAYSEDNQHHIAGVGYDSPSWKEKNGIFNGHDGNFLVPSTTGRTIRTNRVWNHMRFGLEQMLQFGEKSCPVFNCSQGAAIQNTRPVTNGAELQKALDGDTIKSAKKPDFASIILPALDLAPFQESHLLEIQKGAADLLHILVDFAGNLARSLGETARQLDKIDDPGDIDDTLANGLDRLFDLLQQLSENTPPPGHIAAGMTCETIRKSCHIVRHYFWTGQDKDKKQIALSGLAYLELYFLRAIAGIIHDLSCHLPPAATDLKNTHAVSSLLILYQNWWRQKDIAGPALWETVGAILQLRPESDRLLEETLGYLCLNHPELYNPDMLPADALALLERQKLPTHHHSCPCCGSSQLSRKRLILHPYFPFLVANCVKCGEEFLSRRYLHPEIRQGHKAYLTGQPLAEFTKFSQKSFEPPTLAFF